MLLFVRTILSIWLEGGEDNIKIISPFQNRTDVLSLSPRLFEARFRYIYKIAVHRPTLSSGHLSATCKVAQCNGQQKRFEFGVILLKHQGRFSSSRLMGFYFTIYNGCKVKGNSLLQKEECTVVKFRRLTKYRVIIGGQRHVFPQSSMV